jgi:hypothetical protein
VDGQAEMTPRDAAQWMLDEVRGAGALDHVLAVDHLLATSPRLIKWNGQGQPMIRTAVLRSFRRSRGLDIVWAPAEFRWRPLQPGEQAPRRWRR